MAKARTDGDDEYRALVDRCMEELRLKNEAHDAAWQVGTADWSVDQPGHS